jgi:hypothetical protein
VEFSSGNDLCKFLHVYRLDIDNVWPSADCPIYISGRCQLTEALITNVEVPQVDSQIIGRDISLLIGIDRYRIDMVCVSIGIYFSRDGSGD